MIAPVKPVIDPEVRKLCARPYPGHPKGCPNFGKRSTCPPRAPLLQELLDMKEPIYAIWTVFDFVAHVARMKELHGDWTQRQLECCLYWQGAARKRLEQEIVDFVFAGATDDAELLLFDDEISLDSTPEVIRCPEACGVNVTATMASIGQVLEWPPVTKTYQVAIVGTALERRCRVCGCTDSRACPGGCSWVHDPQGGNLCSRCAEDVNGSATVF